MSAILQDKSIIITGASTGIGQASARLFAGAGARLVLADLNSEAGSAVADELVSRGASAIFVETDVSNESAVQAMVQAALAAHGRLDGAFNNAGIGFAGKRIHELDQGDWQRTIGVNLTGVYLCMKHEIAAMLKSGSGSIVNTGSVASITALPEAAEYNASKHGVLGLTRNVALDYGGNGIRVNAVLPGATQTPLLDRQAGGSAADDDDPRAYRSALGRIAAAEEIAQAALWLLSDAASYVTGSALKVDGGFTLA